MSALLIGQGCYERVDNVPLVLKNLVFEQDPTNVEDQVSLYSRPGLDQLLTQGDQIRGVLRQDGALGSLIFFVTGTTLYKANQDGTGATSVGTIAGTSRVIMAANGSNLLIATGTTLYSSNGSSVATVTFPDGAGVIWVGVLNGYFLAIRANSQRVYFSAIGGITFDGLDYFSAETQPDNLVSGAIHGDEFWLLGQSSVEVHVPSGDPDAPFLRINGRMFPMGCADRDSVGKLDDGFAWVGQDRIVYHDASAPQRISTETIEQKLAQHKDEPLTAWGYTVEGHITYVLNIGTLYTFAFSMGKWTQYGTTGLDYLPCWSAARLTDGRAIVGSLNSGKLWVLDPQSTYDGETGMICEFTAMQTIKDKPLRCDNVLLDCSVGISNLTYSTDNATIQLSVSNDRGKTKQPWRTRFLGQQGDYDLTVEWAGAVSTGGQMRRPGRVFFFRTAPPARFTVRQALLNESRQ